MAFRRAAECCEWGSANELSAKRQTFLFNPSSLGEDSHEHATRFVKMAGPGEGLVSNDGALGRSLERVSDTFETPCGSWSIFKLSKYLLQFTGEARFVDWMERAVYNGIGAALPMAPGGRTLYYPDYILGGDKETYYPAAWACCSGILIGVAGSAK